MLWTVKGDSFMTKMIDQMFEDCSEIYLNTYEEVQPPVRVVKLGTTRFEQVQLKENISDGSPPSS